MDKPATKPLVYPERQATVKDADAALNEMIFIALPAQLYRELSDEASKRQMTIAELFSKSISAYLQATRT